jgi:hypothetical protein
MDLVPEGMEDAAYRGPALVCNLGRVQRRTSPERGANGVDPALRLRLTGMVICG